MMFLANIDGFSSYDMIIGASIVIILSFFFGEFAKKTNVPAVLMLIVLGVLINFGLDSFGMHVPDLKETLKILGTVGLIMIVLEAALELELKKEKLLPIGRAFLIALVGLVASAWAAKEILLYFIDDMTSDLAWIYATPLSILSSAIIIPSVTGLKEHKKEFHIYESTFSDILGILMFIFLVDQFDPTEESGGTAVFLGTTLLTVLISLVASYVIVLIFQNIESHVKLFLLIAVLLLLYAVGKKANLSSLFIILIFGLLIANMKLFFRGFLKKWLDYKNANHIYEGLHVVTMETAFVVRTFFFVVFGITITLSTLADAKVAMVSLLIIASIYAIRYVLLRIFIGRDILPQLFIAPRGLITILLFYKIPESLQVESFNSGILLFIIIGTSLIMTFAMIADKNKTGKAVNQAKANPVGYEKWVAPDIDE